jgi:3-hydroxyacyl-CoA dehydrogenase
VSEAGYRIQGRVAVITFDNPPVNGLSHAVRTALAEALARAQADPSCDTIVIAGGRRHFSAGADIREFGTPAAVAEPTLGQVIDRVERSDKPVIAAIRGNCLGGGLELALAAHHRIAAADASLGLPEVKLGLIPGAGGTQRLPRLVGPARALDLILTSEAVRAEAWGDSGLLDRLVSGDPIAEAVAFAASREVTRPPRRTRDLRVEGAELAQAAQAARSRLAGERHPLPAHTKAVDAVEAAGLPFEEGLAVERTAFVELMSSPESKALRHAFLAERAAGKVEGVTDATPARTITGAAVIGAGTMGAGIAVSLLDAGIPVCLLEADEASLSRGRARVAGIYEAQVQKRRLTPAERDRRLGRLRPTLAYDAIAQADLAIEAVVESLPVKLGVFAALDRVM